MVLNRMFDWIFAPITNNFSDLVSITLISFILTAFITWIYKKFTDQIMLKNLREEMGKLRADMKNHTDNPEKLSELNKKIWELSGKQMRNSLRPTLITFLPLILTFNWMRTAFSANEELIHWGFYIPLFGTGFGWLGTYIVASIIFSIILRKIFKIY